jgi:tripartite-type tricarboxylate transporter receptor subunit TctC
MHHDSRPDFNGLRIRKWHVTAIMLGGVAVSLCARADYPERPIRLIVPLAVGGGTDVVARTVVAPSLGTLLGQPVVVENQTAASGQLAYETVSRAKPDGYTLLIGTNSLASMRLTNKAYTLDPANDFAPITSIESRQSYLVSSTGIPARTIPEFVAYAKANPGKVNYGAGGTIDILLTQWLNKVAGMDTTIVPYRGGALALQATAAGDVQFTWNYADLAKPLVDAGKVRVLASSGAKRSSFTPDIPPVAETYPDYAWDAWTGLVTAKGTPQAIVDRVFSAAKAGFSTADSQKRFKQIGSELDLSASPADFSRFLREETDKWSRIAKDTNFKVD